MADKSKLLPYEHDHENEVMPFAATNFRNAMKKFGILTDDRRRHVYIIGKTGMGKTTLQENMFLHDVYAGHGCCYVDPHGDTAEKLLDFIPPNRINDVIYFNPADIEHPIGFNIFEIKNEGQKHLVAAGLMAVFKKIWEGVWSSRMEYILLNTVLALLDAPGSTLLGINRMLSDEEYRKRVVSLIQDPVVKTFWIKEFAAFSEKYRTEAVAPVQNKVGQFLSASIIRNIVAQVKSTMNLREIMDNRKILILNLSKGLVGEENSRLLGGMIITRMQLAAMERVDTPESEREDFFLYVDEFQNFATESFANILSEARKYRLSLTVAHQYIEQLDETVAAAIFGNVGTIITFRVGSPDAVKLVQEFTPRFTEEDLVNLKKFEIYLKLMIRGAASEPFSATTLPPIAQRTGSTNKVIKVSRERYSTPRNKIEDKVLKWSGMGTSDTGATIRTEEEQEQVEETATTDQEAEKSYSEDISDEDQEIEERIKVLQASSPNIPELPKSASQKKKEAKYEMPCSVCGKISKLNFEPDRSRPWYCKEHLEERQKAMEEARKRGVSLPTSRPPRNPAAEAAPVGLAALSKPPDMNQAPPSKTARPAPAMQPKRPVAPPRSFESQPVVRQPEGKSVSLSSLSGGGSEKTEKKPESPGPVSGQLVEIGSGGRPKAPKAGRTVKQDGERRRSDRPQNRPKQQPERSVAPPIAQAKPVASQPSESISLSALTPREPVGKGEKGAPDKGDAAQGRHETGNKPDAAEPPKKAAPDDSGKPSGSPLKPGQVIKFD